MLRKNYGTEVRQTMQENNVTSKKDEEVHMLPLAENLV